LASRVLGFSNGELSWGTICRVLMKEMATIRHRQRTSAAPRKRIGGKENYGRFANENCLNGIVNLTSLKRQIINSAKNEIPLVLFGD